jgi:hypothetical protein
MAGNPDVTTNVNVAWALVCLAGAGLFGAARPLAAWVWLRYAKPYGFGTERLFRWTYRLAGAGLVVLSVVVLKGLTRPDVLGALLCLTGVQVALTSQHIGMVHWSRSGFASRAVYQGSWLAVGIGWSIVAFIVLVGEAIQSGTAR